VTTIEWTDHTLNPLVGCTHASAGCKNCYAESASKTGRLQQFSQYHGVVDERGHWTGKINFVPEQLKKLFKFRKPTRVFMPSMSDPFHTAVKDEWLDQIFAAIALNPQVTVQMLTKRPERMLKYFEQLYGDRFKSESQLKGCEREDSLRKIYNRNLPLSNLHLGVSIENQKNADERIPVLLQTPAALRFLSVEPLLEAVELTKRQLNGNQYNYLLNDWSPCGGGARGATAGGRIATFQSAIEWVIVGGESGPGARPCDTDWIYSIVEQCKNSDVAVFVKQMGSRLLCECRTPEHPDWDEFGPIYRMTGKGTDINEWPERLRVREFPEGERA
jgi:protein gp37